MTAARAGEGGGFVRWWSTLGTTQRIGAALLAVVVAANLVGSALGSALGPEPGGPTSSSLATASDGLEGYADLLAAAGHPVERLRAEVTGDDLAPGDTVVVADPGSLRSEEATALVDHVVGGGRLVALGQEAAPLVASLAGGDVRWVLRGESDELVTWAPVDGIGQAERIASSRGGRWAGSGTLLPVAGDDRGPIVLAGDVGSGRVLAVADADVLQNANLASADNAALGLALAGDPSRPVRFVESVHGFGGEGLSAVPPGWKWAAAGAALTLALGLWAAGSRVGPPEPSARTLRPARRDHVDALAATLTRIDPLPARPVDAPTATVPPESHPGGPPP